MLTNSTPYFAALNKYFKSNTVSFFLIVLFSFIQFNSSGQILSYTTSTTGALNFVAANAAGTNLVRVNGATAPSSPCSTGFSSTSFTSTATYTSTLGAVEVTVTPNAGYALNITSFSASLRRSSSGPASVRFAYSVNGGASWTDNGADIANPSVSCGAGPVITWTSAVYVSSGTLSFRIYGYNASSTSGIEQIINLSINGTVDVISTTGCAIPGSLAANNITSTTATLNWGAVANATSYKVQYRKSGTTIWTTKSSKINSLALTGLTPATAYKYHVKTVCSTTSSSVYSAIASFTTLPVPLPLPKPDHIVILIFENHSYNSIIGSSAAPHINALAVDTSSALFTQSFATTHPSQPNYLDFYSGSNQGVTNDNLPANIPFTTANLGRQLFDSGFSFTTYSEDLPSVGYNGTTSGAYARKHNPAANWMGTGINQIATTTNQPFTAFPSSVNYASLPTVCYVVPNENNDMHNGSDPGRITTGDNWMYNNLNNYIQWAKTHNSLFIMTFDEDDNSASNRVATIFAGANVKAGQYANTTNHYGVLRTIEDMYGLPYAGNAATATTIDYCWKTGSAPVALSGAVAAANSVLVYPNPAYGSVHFSMHAVPDETTEIAIYNSMGILQGKYKPDGKKDFIIATGSYTPGNYFYVVTNKNIRLQEGRFMVAGIGKND